jgi:hypothetical protein
MLLVVIIMFYNDLWGFSIDPPYFGYNSAEQENPILHILCFKDLPGLKLTWDFSGVNILPRESTWRRISQQDEAQGPNEHRWHGPMAKPRHPTHLQV